MDAETCVFGLFLVLTDQLPYQTVKQCFLSFQKVLDIRLVSCVEILFMGFDEINGSIEIISAILDTFRFSTHNTLNTKIFSDSHAQ